MKEWVKLYTQMPWDRKILWTAALLSLIPAAAAFLLRSPAEISEKPNRPAQVDTYIPKGFVLVPIEVQNYESLDSILGRFGVVDLFTEQNLVARNVRLLRAPQNPSHFAILIPESESARILKFGSSFTVVVKRPEATGTEFVKANKTTRRKIIYEGDRG